MTDILVTKAAVRKLAASLASTDTTTLRHTERLALIADAFGWKEDAFMHALKAHKGGVVPQGDIGYVKPWERMLGVPPSVSVKIERIMRETFENPGVVIVGGPTGSGKTTTISALSRHAEESGFPLVELMSANSDWSDEHHFEWLSRAARFGKFKRRTFVVAEVRTAAVATLASELAVQGNIVIAGMAASSAPNVIGRWPSLLEGIYGLEQVRGVVVQRLARRKCSCGDKCDPAHCSGYRGRFAIMDIVEPQSLPEGFYDHDRYYDGLALAMSEAVEFGLTDREEADRMIGLENISAALERRPKSDFSRAGQPS